jgi:hypothetical protein
MKCKVSINALERTDYKTTSQLHENDNHFAEWMKGEINRSILSDNDEKVRQNAADFVTANGKAKWPIPVCTS